MYCTYHDLLSSPPIFKGNKFYKEKFFDEKILLFGGGEGEGEGEF